MDGMPDLRPRWYVMIGNQFIAGLGQTYPGYQQNNLALPTTPGLVITQLERRAMMFTSLEEARKLAKNIDGRVMKVDIA